MDEAKFLKRKVRSGNLDVHPTEKALVVNYDVEALILGELGDPMLGDRKECQKIIRLKSLNADTNVALLAKEVMEKCSLIHGSKLREVEQLIYYLQTRRTNDEVEDVGIQLSRPASSHATNTERNVDIERAIISNIDSYIELMYEEIPGKIRGSSLILQLARVPDNLLELTKNESLLSALARVLREDWRRSIELSTNIVYIFFCFSTYSQFHSIVLEYRIGSLCMDIIDFELGRYDQWKEDMEKRRRHFESTTGLSLFPTEIGNNLDKKAIVGDEIWNADGPLDFEVKRRSVELTSSATDVDVNKMKEDIEKSRKKFKSLTRKQEQLLRVAFYLLLNIAENTEVERKMRKKNVIGMLIKTLDRSNTDLLILVVTFLKKLSIFRENKDLMADLNVIEKLPRLLHNSNSDLIQSTLKLSFNLSFDTKLRSKMIRVGLLPKLVTLLIQSEIKNKTTILGLLYHLSMDDKVKSMFTYTDCIPMVTDMILVSNDNQIKPELTALCINLAANKRNAQLMVENNILQGLIRRAFRTQDPLVMKMIRNISQHDCTKESFIEFVGDFATALTQSESQDFVLEIVGVLGNLTLPDLDYSQILRRCNLIPWIRNNLVPGKAQDDLVLEVVIFLGTAAYDEMCARLLCKADILLSLVELLRAKQEDDEIVLQIIYVFYQIAKHDSTRDYLIRETGNEAPGYLIDLMHDKNPMIRKVCDACLDVIALCDEDWAARIKVEKFRSHNQQWLEMVESITLDPTNHLMPDEDDSLPPFASGDLLKHTMLFPTSNAALFNADDVDVVAKSLSDASENPSRPVSRYTRDLDEMGELTAARSRSRLSIGSGIEDLCVSKMKCNEFNASHVLI
ncbi:kinesin-associated protein 3 isoform X1 [Neodiprion pinetum]|uniref:Kinesin-associated protein 3 isoform X1 n=2 Tax=Neodiprion lecontei TaxID=441921 RepID=A0ABM3FUV9_NEOLC|nr:kinesin-associated protein 3 isoform X1 [Neodiprion pinetum]XP_046591797.1 kinesin-associated protein 3 isoform X1 [Neodiprion lecontei]